MNSFLDIPGLQVGHYTDSRRPTGCTVVLCEQGACAAISVRGYATGTRETQLLDPLHTVDQVHAVLLTGGSTFGLDACTGVMRYLEERNVGFPVGTIRIPIVPAAVLFDLFLGDNRIRPDFQAGYQACLAASSESLAEGNVGAGTGALVGKLLGMDGAMKGGVGHYSLQSGNLIVGAVVAVNALGDIFDPHTGNWLAGARKPGQHEPAGAWQELLSRPLEIQPGFGQNTTIGCIATNALLDKRALTQIAHMSHNGLARAIRPVHTTVDGDTIFALSTGRMPVPGWAITAIGSMAAEALAQAVVRAILAAQSIPGYPAAGDMPGPF